jgi:hypothetical protein
VRAVFEQPKHLSKVRYQRAVRTLRSLIIVSALLLSGLGLIALWRQATAGQQVSTAQWVLAGSLGLWVAVVVWLGLRLELWNRHYLEFRDQGLFLAWRGGVPFHRFLDWSIAPDPVEPRYTRLRLIYKSGPARKRWTMLLDDEAQISELREMLGRRITHTQSP